jgi:carbamoyl-phosphate synthase large subunit
VDADGEAVGRFLSDKFYKVPLATDKDYIPSIFDIIKKEEIDAFYCVSSAEIGVVAAKKEYLEQEGCVVLASGKQEIAVAENKALLYDKLSTHGIPTPKACVVKTLDEFTEAVGNLGYPDEKVCFKPPVGKGSRGFRILDASVNRRDLLMNHKPNSLYMSLDEFQKIFQNDPDFPELVVMDVAAGDEFDVMALCGETGALLVTVKSRESNRWGIINRGEQVDSPIHRKLVKEIIRVIPLKYNICLQFIEDKIIEINPRPSTYIYQKNLNEPYLAIKLALGELSENEIRQCQKSVEYGRRMIRYMDQVFFSGQEVDFGPSLGIISENL